MLLNGNKICISQYIVLQPRTDGETTYRSSGFVYLRIAIYRANRYNMEINEREIQS